MDELKQILNILKDHELRFQYLEKYQKAKNKADMIDLMKIKDVNPRCQDCGTRLKRVMDKVYYCIKCEEVK